ncbi:MAG: respiratory nitrate reductase subunit beta [Gammaproteobacteria bacterium]|nr:respiratory nitrate reductase subunit beta [Gammaproteobacteria bacterium]
MSSTSTSTRHPSGAVEAQNQFAMVFDLNKCLGCQTCSIACKTQWTRGQGRDAMWWNIVNTLPGKGTPRDAFSLGGGYADGEPLAGELPGRKDWGEAWDYAHERVFYRSGDADTQWNQPDNYLKPMQRDGSAPHWGPNWEEDMGGGEYPHSYFFYLPLVCMNCAKPACLEACPRDSIYRRQEDGIVLIDEDRCHGYRFCMEACPYKRIYFNEERVIAQKCISCYPRLEAGVAPACVRQCPGRMRHVGFLNDPESHIHKLVNQWRVALPLRPDFEVAPRVYYVPPSLPTAFNEAGEFDESRSRFPIEQLEDLFGPEVGAALSTIEAERQKVADGGTSALMDILIAHNWQDLLGPFTKDPGAMARPTADKTRA